jgi:hypothetical protein
MCTPKADHRDARTFALHDAQFALARAYGFESWPKLKAAVDGVTSGGRYLRLPKQTGKGPGHARYQDVSGRFTQRGAPTYTEVPVGNGLFIPRRPNQSHCQPSCRKRAARKADADRVRALLERLDPIDPGRAE